MRELFQTFLLLSCVGTMLGAVLMLFRPITKRLFSVAWHYYMWLVVLFVMVLPVRLQVPSVSVPAQVPQMETAVKEMNAPREREPVPAHEGTPVTAVVSEPVQTEEIWVGEAIQSFFNKKVPLLSFLWALGAVLFFAKKLLGYLVLLGTIRRHSAVITCPQLAAYTSRHIMVRVSSKISSPFMTGLVRPVLLLPDIQMTETQLEHVLSHEMVHFKRGDIYYKWFVSLVSCLHWFNPFIYWMSRQMSIDCEASCDLEVVRKLDQAGEKSYVNTILMLVASHKRSLPLTTGMTGGKHSLKKRFMMLTEKMTVSRRVTIASVVVSAVVILGAVLISGALNGHLLSVPDHPLMSLSADEREGEAWNTLLIGTDAKGRADAILLISCNKDSMVSCSVPRNALFGSGKRLSEYLAGENGDQQALNAVREAFHIPISYYARIDLHAVEEMIDQVGGLELEVPMDMVYEDPYQDLYINLKRGRQQLNGRQVSQLLRYRSGYADGEFSRMAMHQTVLEALISQKIMAGKTFDFAEIYELLSRRIVTNYPLQTLLQDYRHIKSLDSSRMQFDIIPGANVVADNGTYAYEIDYARANEMLKAFRPESDSLSLTPPAARAVPLAEEQPLAVSKPQEAVPAAMQDQNRVALRSARIKSDVVATEPYIGFEQVLLSGKGIDKIRQELVRQGLMESQESLVKLQSSFAVRDYSQTDNRIRCDEKGNISLFFAGNQEELMDICFYDAATGADVGQYCILADGKAAYSFLGFDTSKDYRLTVRGKTQGDWQIEGEYIIY